MRNRVVIYSVAGIVAMSLIAAAAFRPHAPASGSGAVAPTAVIQRTVVSGKRAVAKVVHAAARPATPVSAEADSISPLPRSYRVLLAHSLFSSQPTTSSDSPGVAADSELALRGVFQSGRRCIAYIENTASHQYQELNVGDAVGIGKLVAIDLNGVRYAAAGRNVRVEVGQTFKGARAIQTAQTSTVSTFRQITE